MQTIRLNLGAGNAQLPGYRNLDGHNGDVLFPLPVDDCSVDEIRASHVLEHFSHRVTGSVLADWVRALKPGGEIYIAVPDLARVAKAYLDGVPGPWQAVLMGGQVDNLDVHLAAFDREALTEAMLAAGLADIDEWPGSDLECSGLPFSLNLCGRKPSPKLGDLGKVVAVMSVPRLGFMDNFQCMERALRPLGIGTFKHTGAFWGQTITEAMERAIAGGAGTILTVDYDSVFTPADVVELLKILQDRPAADAVCALQSHRMRPLPLMTVLDDDGTVMSDVPWDWLQRPALRIRTGHFGLTAIRAAAVVDLPPPWFHGRPGDDGRWGDDKVDDDIAFWHLWFAEGRTLYLAPRVAIGHAELMIRWPGEDLQAIHQHPSEFWADGKPKGCWR